MVYVWLFFFSSRRRHTRWNCDWSSDVCSSDLTADPKVTRVVPVPPPHRIQDSIVRGPIRSRGGGHRIEAARDDEIERRDSGEEEQVHVGLLFDQAASEGHGAGRMAESLGVDREVSVERPHRPGPSAAGGKTF